MNHKSTIYQITVITNVRIFEGERAALITQRRLAENKDTLINMLDSFTSEVFTVLPG